MTKRKPRFLWYRRSVYSCRSTKTELMAFRKREAAFKAGDPPTMGQTRPWLLKSQYIMRYRQSPYDRDDSTMDD